MGSPGIGIEDAQQFIQTVEACLREGYTPLGMIRRGKSGALREACSRLNIPFGSAHSRRQAAERAAGRTIDWSLFDPEADAVPKAPLVQLPTFPDDDISAEEILNHLSKRFEKKLENENAKHWFTVQVNSTLPVGFAVVGDPHLGSQCNIPLLRSHIDIMAKTDGMMVVNIGDTADNWGRLVHLYAEDDISRPTERKLARWFLKDAGIPWIAWLHGNHDTMHSEFSTFLKSENVAQIPMVDWRAKFKLRFPNGGEVKVDAAHNHKGSSIYNRLQGQKRAALWDENADIYVAGHHHKWALSHEELDDGRIVWMGRARGYKWIDEYATRHNFHRDEHGATILFVIDPREENAVRRISAFADLEEGTEFLSWKRQKYER